MSNSCLPTKYFLGDVYAAPAFRGLLSLPGVLFLSGKSTLTFHLFIFVVLTYSLSLSLSLFLSFFSPPRTRIHILITYNFSCLLSKHRHGLAGYNQRFWRLERGRGGAEVGTKWKDKYRSAEKSLHTYIVLCTRYHAIIRQPMGGLGGKPANERDGSLSLALSSG
jgi:hypothetical protein